MIVENFFNHNMKINSIFNKFKILPLVTTIVVFVSITCKKNIYKSISRVFVLCQI